MDAKYGQVSNIVAVLIISVAVFFDLVQALIDVFHFIPVVGNIFAMVATWLVSAVAFFIFWFWFMLYGVHFNTTKRVASMGGGFLIELIPVLNALPAWTLAVILVILTARMPKIAQTFTPAGIPKLAIPINPLPQPSPSQTDPAVEQGFDKRPQARTASDGIRRADQ